jgi:PTS system mannose-specific IIA component
MIRSEIQAKKRPLVAHRDRRNETQAKGIFMIGMVLVTHGGLAVEFIRALEHVVGPQKNVCTVCIGPDDDMEDRRQEIIDCVAKTDEGDGVAILTDMFGGTPSNLAISILDKGPVEVIAGINLPMLIKLAGLRSSASLADAVAQAQEAGKKYINVASQLLASEVP